jgi:hypothetical protein
MNKNIALLLTISFCIFGCQKNKYNEYKETFSVVGGISSYTVEYKNDSIFICGIHRNKDYHNDSLILYSKNGVFYTKSINNQEELIMSNLIVRDTLFLFYEDTEYPLHRYRIKIENKGDSLYISNLFHEGILIDEKTETSPVYLDLQLFYDRDYKIKTISKWNIIEFYEADEN